MTVTTAGLGSASASTSAYTTPYTHQECDPSWQEVLSGTTTCNRAQQGWPADCVWYASRTLSLLGNDSHTPKLHDCKLGTIHWQPVGSNKQMLACFIDPGSNCWQQWAVHGSPQFSRLKLYKRLLAHKKQVEGQSSCEQLHHLSSRELGGSPTSASTLSSSCVVCRPATPGRS